jgi:hypothetical protein
MVFFPRVSTIFIILLFIFLSYTTCHCHGGTRSSVHFLFLSLSFARSKAQALAFSKLSFLSCFLLLFRPVVGVAAATTVFNCGGVLRFLSGCGEAIISTDDISKLSTLVLYSLLLSSLLSASNSSIIFLLRFNSICILSNVSSSPWFLCRYCCTIEFRRIRLRSVALLFIRYKES